MRHSSLRGNLLWLAGIYFVSLVVASGCPTNDAPPSKPTSMPAASNPPETSVEEALRTVDAPPNALEPVASSLPLEPAPPASAQPPAVESIPAERPAAAVARPVTAEPAAPPPVTKEPALLPQNPNEPQTSIAFKGPAIPVETSGNGKPAGKLGDDYFQGWEKPQLALVITGEQNGYMEPCGCAGLENMKGGIGRRHDMIQQLKAKGWPVAAVDVGGLVRRFGIQAELQFEKSADALRLMGYNAVGLGVADLKLSAGEVAVKAAPEGPEKSIFCSTNADVIGLIPKWRIFTAGGLKIGVAAVLNESNQKEVKNAEVVFTDADLEIQAALQEFKDCDHRILLAIAPVNPDPEPDPKKRIKNSAKELAAKYPEFDIVATGGLHGDPPHLMRNAAGKAMSGLDGSPLKDAAGQIFVETGDKGMFTIVLAFYPGEKLPHYQRVALDKRYQVTPEMRKIMAALQGNYEALGWEGLGIKARPHSHAAQNDPKSGQFVGSASCRNCHTDAYDIWKESGHGHASDTLIKLSPERMHDAECVACHVTGWNPKEFTPYDTGFLGLNETPHLVGNGCENCHGPGASHVAAEQGNNASLQKQLRDLMHIDLEHAAESCKNCHDDDNSPEFRKQGFDKYWEKIAH